MFLVYKKGFLNYLWFSLAYFGYVIVHFGNMENKINLNPSELFPVAKMREYHILGIISGVFSLKFKTLEINSGDHNS